MKILLAILLFPLLLPAQTMTDSTNVVLTSGAVIRFTTTHQATTYVDGDSLRFRSTTSKKLGLVSPLTLPVSTATQTALNSKQNTLVSGTNIKTVNGNNILGSGDVPISGSAAWGSVTGTLSNQTDLNSALNGKLATNGSAASLTNFPTFNQNTTGTAAGLSAILSFASGGISGAAATPATTGAMTVPMTSTVITITPTGACTFNASGGVAGQRVTFAVTTSGTTSFVLTFGTNFRKVGTLATGTVSARFFSVTFICINGTIWQEIGRTAAQT